MATLEEARSATAAEWASRSPKSPEEIVGFYRESGALRDELDAWHLTEDRRKWTEAIVYVAQKIEASLVVDIGCGGGQDLIALNAAGIPRLYGVEPNEELAARTRAAGIVVGPDVAKAPIEDANLIVCIEVLEHVVDPDAFLGSVAERARPNAVLIESTGTFDLGTPLHLEENRGWHPGHVLERYGWEVIDHTDRMRVWQRVRPRNVNRSTVLLCAYRTVSLPTLHSLMALSGVTSTMYDHDTGSLPEPRLTDGGESAWRITTKTGDGLVSRARSIVVSRWWAETADDVFLMIDDDISFSVDEAERVVAAALRTEGIVCGAYPIRSGVGLALRGLEAQNAIDFGPDKTELVEIEYAATGFMAVHRKVIDAMVPTLELVHADQPWSFWPLFAPLIVPMGPAKAYLSEDWSFCHRARDLGFKVYVDPSIKLGHLAQIELDVHNMSQVARAVGVKSL